MTVTQDNFAEEFTLKYARSLSGGRGERMDLDEDLFVLLTGNTVALLRADWQPVDAVHAEELVERIEAESGLRMVVFAGLEFGHRLVPGPYQNGEWFELLDKQREEAEKQWRRMIKRLEKQREIDEDKREKAKEARKQERRR